MSHEIRTPLNGILGMLQLLDISHLNEEQRQFCSQAMQSTDCLTRLLSDIHDLSRIEAGKMHLRQVPFSLREVVGQVVDLFVSISVQSEVMLQHHLSAALDLLDGRDFDLIIMDVQMPVMDGQPSVFPSA